MRLSIQKPTDQPTGTKRLLEDLRNNLLAADLSEFKFVVAYAKVGPLLRLAAEIKAWVAAGKRIDAVFGTDQKQTSEQVLDFALQHFSSTYVVHTGGSHFSLTFHPKIYLFSGDTRAIAYVGSNNLTVGGTETNYESHVRIEIDLPRELPTKVVVDGFWGDAAGVATPLTAALLAQLVASGIVVNEAQMRVVTVARMAVAAAAAPLAPPSITVLPPSPIPKSVLAPTVLRRVGRAGRVTVRGVAPAPVAARSLARALVIQVRPHPNGEVFLSKQAVDQDRGFFGWPFTGRTVPKRAPNIAYPQRLPDPVVDLTVYDRQGNVHVRHDPFELNTVFYERKSEIRITVPPDVVRATPQMSILVMEHSSSPQRDYDISIYPPGSPQYNGYLRVCNQVMPTGGVGGPRRFGWL